MSDHASTGPDKAPCDTGAPIPTALDIERYRHHVDHFDLPEARKVELLQAIWQMMQNFVDRAFGDDPVQHVRKAGDERNAKAETSTLPVI